MAANVGNMGQAYVLSFVGISVRGDILLMIYPYLQQILPKINNPTVIEIGAHMGTDTIRLVHMLQYPYRYLAIEPDSRNLAKLHPLLKDFQVEIIPKAIGSVDGVVPFNFSSGIVPGTQKNITDCNSLMQPKANIKVRPWMTFEKSEVHCITLDRLCLKYGIEHIDLIWMDVQGAELEVFKGGQRALQQTDYIYTECQENMYHGQPGLSKILEVLPMFEMIVKNGDNVLLRRE
jgi:FkbM family methyltransferase